MSGRSEVYPNKVIMHSLHGVIKMSLEFFRCFFLFLKNIDIYLVKEMLL